MGKNPFLRTLVLVVLAAGLVAYLWFVERKKPAEGEEKPAEKVFAAFDKAKVRSLTLARQGGETIAVVKEGASWRLTEPLRAAAAVTEVDALLSNLEGLEVGSVVHDKAPSASEYGLEPPRTTLNIGREGAEPLVLLLGDKAPAESGLYAKLPGSGRVFTIPATSESTFDKKAFDLRDRNVLHFKRDDVKAIAVRSPRGAYALARGDNGDWSFTRPIQTAAARWSVDSFVGTLESLRMDSVADENAGNLARFGLEPPEQTVTLTLTGGSQQVLGLGKATTDDKRYAREASSALVAVVPKVIAEDLGKGMDVLRAKRVLEVAAYEVESVEIVHDGAASRFAKTKVKDKDGIETEKWKKLGTGGAPDNELAAGKLDDALYKMGSIEATSFIDKPGPAAAYGLDKPVLKATIGRSGGKATTWFELGRSKGKAYARRADDQALLAVDPAKVDELLQALRAL